MNLAVNARDAMPSGGKLTIETSNVSLDEEYAVFTLHSARRLRAAFHQRHGPRHGFGNSIPYLEPFFTTKGPKGTGLGLSTVYGNRQAKRRLRLGFQRTWQRYHVQNLFAAGCRESGTRAGPASNEAAFTAPGTETILLAEDEANLRYLARQFLEKQGYTVIEAADGTRAMQIALAHQGVDSPAVNRWIMPGMNGRELAQRISEIRPQTKILYMSGYTENVIGPQRHAGCGRAPASKTLHSPRS